MNFSINPLIFLTSFIAGTICYSAYMLFYSKDIVVNSKNSTPDRTHIMAKGMGDDVIIE